MATTTPSDSHATAARERKVVNRWVALTVGLLAVAVMFALAYLHASTAVTSAKEAGEKAQGAALAARRASAASQETADCVNNILATRAAVTQADSQALRDYIDESSRLTRAMSVVVSAPPDEQAAKFALFVAETRRAALVTDHSRAVLAADQAYRNAHPLGRC